MALGTQKDVQLVRYSGYSYEGKPILLTKQRGRPVKLAHHKPSWYPEEKKIEAATLYAVTGNLKQVSELTKVSTQTLRNWQAEPWWGTVMEKVRRDHNEDIDGKFTGIIQQSLEVLLDRLHNGDVVILKDGTERRKPLSARDAAIVQAIIFDKRQLVRGEATTRVEKVDSEAKQKKLKDLFERFARAKTIEGEVISPGDEHDASRSSGEETQGDSSENPREEQT